MKISKSIIALALATLVFVPSCTDAPKDADTSEGLETALPSEMLETSKVAVSTNTSLPSETPEAAETPQPPKEPGASYDDDGNKTQQVAEFKDGRTTVTTFCTEGKAKGKPQRIETYRDGTLVSIREHFYDGEGKLMLAADIEYARLTGSPTLRYTTFDNNGIRHSITYRDDLLDASRGVAIPDSWPSFPDSSGYYADNSNISIAFSNGNIIVTLTNTSSSPIEVNENIFMKPEFRLHASSGNTASISSGGATTHWEQSSAHNIVSLAPGASMRCETPLDKILGTQFSDFPGKNLSDFQNSEAQVSITPMYRNLFPLLPDVQSGSFGMDKGGASLGKIGELKTSYPTFAR